MSRILNRPLFRRGGSATGITSGLDRPGYDPGGRVDYPAMYEQAEEITENYIRLEILEEIGEDT